MAADDTGDDLRVMNCCHTRPSDDAALGTDEMRPYLGGMIAVRRGVGPYLVRMQTPLENECVHAPRRHRVLVGYYTWGTRGWYIFQEITDILVSYIAEITSRPFFRKIAW